LSDDTLIPLFLNKLSELDKIISNEKNDRKVIQDQIAKLQQWLAGDRSIQEHKCCQAFLTYLFNSYGDKYKSREGFVCDIKCKLHFADIKITKSVINGEKIIFKKYNIHSLAFPACSQKKHHDFFIALQDFAFKKWGVDFEKWYAEWINNTNTIQ
jgi:hypothetical protein